MSAIQQGIFNVSTKERLDKLEETAAELNAKIAQEELKAPKITREFIDFFFDKYRQMDLDSWKSQQRLVDGLVNAIVVHDDKILVTYNYKEGTETISLSELGGSDLALVGEPCKTPSRQSLGDVLLLSLGVLKGEGK